MCWRKDIETEISSVFMVKVQHYQKMGSFTVRIAISLFCFVSVISAVKWPKETYTLVKPKAGCPSGWLEGWRWQDNEDDNNRNVIDSYHHFFGIIGNTPRNLNFSYCTKDPNDANEEGYWPSGTYCILKHGDTCPPGGFQSGSIIWDDEDSDNVNSKGGELPSGEFGSNTRIDYCCRNDGSYSTEIRLPKSKSFYLLAYSTYCQEVEGMHVRYEAVKTDDEDDDNIDSVSGSHPHLLSSGGSSTELLYCYYWSM